MGLRSGLTRWLIRGTDTTGDWFVAFQDALEANKTFAGTSVTQENATSLSTVYRCISLNTDVVSTTPIDTRVRVGKTRREIPKPRWMESPNDEQDFVDFVAQLQSSLEHDGNAFALKAVTPGGQLAGLYPLNPTAVTVDKPVDIGKLVYIIPGADGGQKVIPATGMLHIRGFTLPGAIRGLSPVAAMKQTIGLGKAAEQFGAQFFGSGATLSGIISTDSKPEPKAVKELQEQFTRKHGGISKSHAIGILTGGATFTPLSVKPEEAQFLETRRFNAVEIACGFGVPPWFVTDTEGAKGYVTGLYATMYMWLLTGINVRFVRLEKALTSLMPKGDYAKFNRNSFLAMDPQDRREFYAAALRDTWMVPNEVREKEDMDPVPWGDEKLLSVQYNAPPGAMEPTNNEPAQAGFLMPEGGSK